MKRNKKIILIISIISLIAYFSSFYIAKGVTTTLEVKYPKFETGEEITPETTLPGYIKYIFKFSFIVAGILAFAFLIYGGIRYLTSAGNPEAMKDARDQIFSAILGLIILLCSYLILININPDILPGKMEKLEPVTGIYLFENEKNKLHYTQSVPQIPENFDFNKIQFISPPEILHSVFAFRKAHFEGDATEIPNSGATTIKSIDPKTESIRFKWNLPGVYLKGEKPGEEIRLVENTPDLGRYYFKGKTKEIELKNASTTNYQAVIHKNRDFEGACQVFTKSGDIEIHDFSSISVFQRREVSYPDPDGAEIILYPLPNYQEYGGDPDTGKEPIEKETYPGERVLPTEIRLKNQVRSIIVPPGYLVILFEEGPTGTNPWTPLGSKCQVFTKSNNDLTKEPIGKCGGRTIVGDNQWDFKPCATHIAIFAIK